MNAITKVGAVFLAGAALAAGCGGDGGGGTPTTNPWVGSYNCTTTSTANVMRPPLGMMMQPPSMGGVTISESGGQLVFTPQAGDGGSSPCVLRYTRNGNSATLVAGQMCSTSNMGIPIGLNFRSGSATLAGNTITGMAEGTLSGMVLGMNLEGTFMASTTCTRR